MNSIQLGFELERKLEEAFYGLNIFNNIFDEKKIVSTYNKKQSVHGIDHLLFIGNYIITVQDKWEVNPPKLENIHKFINVSTILAKLTNKALLCGLFVSKAEITANGQKILDNENQKYKECIYYSLSNTNMDDLVDETINFIKSVLIPHGLYKIDNVEKWELRQDQLNDVNNFVIKLLEPNGLKSGIIVKPTGSGKTVVATSCIGKYWEKYQHSVLWITDRIDILMSQFDDNYKLNMSVKSGFIPDYSKFRLEK